MRSKSWLRTIVAHALVGGVGVTAGCGSEAVSETAAAAPGAMVELLDGAARALSTSGSSVSITATPHPIHVGEVELAIRIEDHQSSGSEPSLDLVSPTMPMHGVVRYDLTQSGNGDYEARIHIPMDGRWAVYINLDAGTDAAWFEFDVNTDANPDANPDASSSSVSTHAH